MFLESDASVRDTSPGLKDKNRHNTHEKFSEEEDKKLLSLIERYGKDSWNIISDLMMNRNARQCKERYLNYLSPNINRNKWTDEEDNLILAKVDELGRKWVKISQYFQNRTDTMLKNRYNVLLRSQKRENVANYPKFVFIQTQTINLDQSYHNQIYRPNDTLNMFKISSMINQQNR